MIQLTALVADLGGTNTRVALTNGATLRADTIRRYRNADYSKTGQIRAILQDYLNQTGAQPDAACVALAGPVSDGNGHVTNLDWHVRRDALADLTGASTVAVLNDLQAQGHSVAHVAEPDLVTLREGRPAGDHAARLVLNVGTGLNAALVYRTDAQTLVPPSESGHITLAAQSDEDHALVQFLIDRHGFASAEEALSGRGVGTLYDFYCAQDGVHQPRLRGEDVMDRLSQGDPRAQHAARLFVRILGGWASDLALVQLPYGGIYLFGGVVRAFGPYLQEYGFEQAFLTKGRFSDFLDAFPVRIVTDDYAPLRGSASHLMELATREDWL